MSRASSSPSFGTRAVDLGTGPGLYHIVTVDVDGRAAFTL
jgi:hypothetical protein